MKDSDPWCHILIHIVLASIVHKVMAAAENYDSPRDEELASPHLKAVEEELEGNAKLYRRFTGSSWDPVHLRLVRSDLFVEKKSSLVRHGMRLKRKPNGSSERINMEDCGLVELRNRCVYLNLPDRERRNARRTFGMTPWTPDEKVIFKFSTRDEAAKWKARLYEASVHSAAFRRQERDECKTNICKS